MSVSANTTRGVRNNNPGNIRTSKGTVWSGQCAEQKDPDFVQCVTPEYGIRMIGKVLRSYNRAGYNTVEKIIGRWAPSSENDTEAYIKNVCRTMGVQRNDLLPIEDEGVIIPLVNAIISQECGGYQYPAETITQGLVMAGYALPGAGHHPGEALTAPHEPEPEIEPYIEQPTSNAGALDMSDDQIAKMVAALAEATSAAVTRSILAQAPQPVVVTSAGVPGKDFSPPLVGQPGSPTNINIPAADGTAGLATTGIVPQQAGSVVAATLPGGAGKPVLRSPMATSLAMTVGLALPWLWNSVLHAVFPVVPMMPDEIAAPLTVFLADAARQRLKIQ